MCRAAWVCGLVLCVAGAGCGGGGGDYEGERRFPLSGRVTVDGQPLESGLISFLPQGGDAQTQRMAGGSISAGAYSVPEEKGLTAGTYRVEIRWNKPTGKKAKDSYTGEEIDETVEGLPAKYHSASELTATVGAERTTHDFDLTTK